jgi:7-carboxy-7-deazaguanine synthase
MGGAACDAAPKRDGGGAAIRLRRAGGGEPMTGLRVIEIFDSLQGEGYWTGTPMTFVRLAGCNAPELGLGCVRWCDTPGSWERGAGEYLQVREILERVHFTRVCLTGGEPLLQAEGAASLATEAHRRGIRVHVETNGTVALFGAGVGDGGDGLFDWVVVSPKPPDYSVAAEWDGLIDELKLVVDEEMDAAAAERLAAAHPEAVISIQPVWERPPECGDPELSAPGPSGHRSSGETSLSRAVRLVMEHPDWRLSLQMHKHLGIR